MARHSTTSLLLLGFVLGAGCSSSGAGFSGSSASRQEPGSNEQQPPGNGQAPPGTPALCSQLCEAISGSCRIDRTACTEECSQGIGEVTTCRSELVAMFRCLIATGASFCSQDQGPDGPPSRQFEGFESGLERAIACRDAVRAWRGCTGRGSSVPGQGGVGGEGGVGGVGGANDGGDAAGAPGDAAGGSSGSDGGACMSGVNCTGCADACAQCYCENGADPTPCQPLCTPDAGP
jgi:hypothetical protein